MDPGRCRFGHGSTIGHFTLLQPSEATNPSDRIGLMLATGTFILSLRWSYRFNCHGLTLYCAPQCNFLCCVLAQLRFMAFERIHSLPDN